MFRWHGILLILQTLMRERLFHFVGFGEVVVINFAVTLQHIFIKPDKMFAWFSVLCIKRFMCKQIRYCSKQINFHQILYTNSTYILYLTVLRLIVFLFFITIISYSFSCCSCTNSFIARKAERRSSQNWQSFSRHYLSSMSDWLFRMKPREFAFSLAYYCSLLLYQVQYIFWFMLIAFLQRTSLAQA